MTSKVEKALAWLDERVEICRAETELWQAKRDRGECEQISVATERSAYFEADLIRRHLTAMLLGKDVADERARRRAMVDEEPAP